MRRWRSRLPGSGAKNEKSRRVRECQQRFANYLRWVRNGICKERFQIKPLLVQGVIASCCLENWTQKDRAPVCQPTSMGSSARHCRAPPYTLYSVLHSTFTKFPLALHSPFHRPLYCPICIPLSIPVSTLNTKVQQRPQLPGW